MNSASGVRNLRRNDTKEERRQRLKHFKFAFLDRLLQAIIKKSIDKELELSYSSEEIINILWHKKK